MGVLPWKSALERSLVPVAFRTGLVRPARYFNRGKAVILTYHGFTTDRVQRGIENHEFKHVHVDDFRRQVRFLKRYYHVLPLAELVRLCASGSRLPDRAAVITIDDGYRSTFRVAYPVLRELGAPAVVFVASDFVEHKRFLWTDRVEYAIDRADAARYELVIGRETLAVDLTSLAARMGADRLARTALKALPQDSRDEAVASIERELGCRLGETEADVPALYEPLEWSEAAEMIQSGVMSVGSHTHNHLILSRCSEGVAAQELAHSKRLIEDRLGIRCDLFCYPNGRRGDFNGSTKRLVRDAGYVCALTTVHGMNRAGADVYELKRFPVTGRMQPGELEVRLSGLAEWPTAVTQAAFGLAAGRGGSRRNG